MPYHALEALDRLGGPEHFGSHSLFLQGEALRELGRYLEAVVPLERAAQIAPSNVQIWLSLGWCQKRLGRIHRAVDTMEQAVAAKPELPIVHYNLACYLSLLGKKNRALIHLAEALILDPEYRDLIDAERDFDPIRDDAQFQAITSIIV